MRPLARCVPVALFLMACGGTPVSERGALRRLDDVPRVARSEVARKRIFFGHQSVGSNIVDGLVDLVHEQPALGLHVLGLDASRTEVGGFFAHEQIGANEQPATKTEAFARLMDEGLAGRLDVAFHKYCFVDIAPNADPRALFGAYRATMERLRLSFPHVTFVHVTVPLTTVQDGPKAAFKKLLGRVPAGYAGNLAREEFNEAMRQAYRGREPVFDLAAVEASLPGGGIETFTIGGRHGLALVPAYASDGAHLNRAGRRVVAESLLAFLAELPGRK
jgi:hypothetical protein